MGSLGGGGWALGRLADRRRDPWRLYARLEALVALTAAVTPPLLAGARAVYLGLGGTLLLGALGGNILRLLLAALVIGPPMVLAGGTLPAAARAVVSGGDRGRRALAVLYGVNTLGAVAGALAATFLLLAALGTRATLWLACLVNLLLAAAAGAVAIRAEERADADDQPLTAAAPPWLVQGAAGAVGFAFFLMELVWYRMLAPILGGTVYTFGLILAVALAGIGLGGLAYALAAGRRRPTIGAFAATCWAEAACIAAPFVAGDRLAALALRLRPAQPQGLPDYGPGWMAVTAIVVLPAALVAGAQFPLLVALLGRGREAVGRQLGQAYAFNTAGAIAGALAGGFGLLPLLGAPNAWRAVAVGLAVVGLASAVAGRAHRLTALACLAGVGALSGALLAAPGPSSFWRHSGIGAGRFQPVDLSRPNELEDAERAARRATVWEAEGVESSVALEAVTAYAFAVNGKVDGNARHDAPTQVMSGLMGALLHPGPRTSLVIGLGTGTTAGWLAAVPTMEHTEVDELEPAIVEVARACAAVNRRVLDDPRVTVRFADAREVLMTTRSRYDIIFSEPSNPYRAGVASFFTRDFYAAASRRLAPGGVLLQWLQGYEVDADTIDVVLATLASVFDAVEIWQTQGQDLLLIASGPRSPMTATAFAARLGEEPFKSGLRAAWDAESPEAALAHYVGGPAVAREALARGVRPNTDDANRVEFGFARNVGRAGQFRIEQLRDRARRLGAERPAMGAAVDWRQVEAERVTMYSTFDEPLPIDRYPGHEPVARAAAHTLYRAGKRVDALAVFRRQARPPTGPFERALVAEGLAELGDPGAPAAIDALGEGHGVEADAIRARLLLRQGRPEEAAALLERALDAYRRDPWPMPRVMRGAVELAEALAHENPALRPRLFAALDQPFAVRLWDVNRLGARLRVAQEMAPEYCRLGLAPFEPAVPWVVDMLLFRRNCYEALGDPRLDDADRDLARFLRGAKAR
jgi:spermidine synthase